MYTLGIDTATDVAVVAICQGTKLLFELYIDNKKAHSIHMMPMVDSAFQYADISKTQIDRICVGKGPGSFTGMRIGIAAAKGLAYGLQKPLVGVSTLMAMAYPYRKSALKILSVVDARNDRAFYGVYGGMTGELEALTPEDVATVDEIAGFFKQNEPLLVVGKELTGLKKALSKRNIQFSFQDQLLRGQSICLLGHQAEMGEENEVLPSYIKLSQAEQNLKGS